MKVTLYELLGLVKDGKAPKKIKFNSEIWMFNKDFNQYQTNNGGGNIWNGYNFNILNDTVEILEEQIISKLYINNELQYDLEEKKLPEKLEGINSLFKIEQDLDLKGFLAWQKANNKMIENKINSIIDYLKSKGE